MRNLFLTLILLFSSTFAFSQSGLQIYDDTRSYPGYTLWPSGTNTYLIDNCGKIINQWTTDNTPSLASYLMEDGNLLFMSRLTSNNTFNGGGGGGGRLDIYDPNSNLVWRYDWYVANDYAVHHDVEPLPNGNILAIVWTEISSTQAISLGRNPANVGNELWYERIVEIQPVGSNQANLVWQWDMIDHLVQDFNASLPNFGDPADFPNKIDINIGSGGGGFGGGDWMHGNGIDYDNEFNQIMLSCRWSSEVYVIDHTTTTAEAASANGGTYGMGGDILYRYGNPQNYGAGTAADKRLHGQHDGRWIEEGVNQGKFTAFNNDGGFNIGTGNSTVDLVTPPRDANGFFTQPAASGVPFSPVEPDVIYFNGPGGEFQTNNMGGAHGLPNGNILVCPTDDGDFIELDGTTQDIVWYYRNPNNQDPFKITRYSADYPGLAFLDLTPGSTVESPSSLISTNCVVDYTEDCNLVVTISGLPSTTGSSSSIALTGTPAGGTFSGPGVVFSAFNPSLAGPGQHTIEYTYDDGNGCVETASDAILVFSLTYNFVNYNLGTISPE